ncbi:MAG TPA: class I SAM-dependent methyltransferase [Candidatus Ozemobacteraceae bacterium]|nr:class I SAM-dependent methyltransferase [Candidatus Ozemobacteraceae bacterium]
MNLSCPTCRVPLQRQMTKLTCPLCHVSPLSAPSHYDFSPWFVQMRDCERERVSLAYRFYSLAYAPLALINMLAVWKASLGKLTTHYQQTLKAATHPILDVAIGDGALTRLATRSLALPHPLVGLDVSRDMLSQAESNLNHLPGFVSVRADACALPFPGQEFQTVCCFGGLHVIAHPERAMAEMARVLRSGGRFAASILLIPHGRVSDYLSRRYVELGFLSTRFTRTNAEALVQQSGLDLIDTHLNGRMLLVSARKP